LITFYHFDQFEPQLNGLENFLQQDFHQELRVKV